MVVLLITRISVVQGNIAPSITPAPPPNCAWVQGTDLEEMYRVIKTKQWHRDTNSAYTHLSLAFKNTKYNEGYLPAAFSCNPTLIGRSRALQPAGPASFEGFILCEGGLTLQRKSICRAALGGGDSFTCSFHHVVPKAAISLVLSHWLDEIFFVDNTTIGMPQPDSDGEDKLVILVEGLNRFLTSINSNPTVERMFDARHLCSPEDSKYRISRLTNILNAFAWSGGNTMAGPPSQERRTEGKWGPYGYEYTERTDTGLVWLNERSAKMSNVDTTILERMENAQLSFGVAATISRDLKTLVGVMYDSSGGYNIPDVLKNQRELLNNTVMTTMFDVFTRWLLPLEVYLAMPEGSVVANNQAPHDYPVKELRVFWDCKLTQRKCECANSE